MNHNFFQFIKQFEIIYKIDGNRSTLKIEFDRFLAQIKKLKPLKNNILLLPCRKDLSPQKRGE